MIDVVCVYWEGDFRGREYTREWTFRLEAMVKRLLSGCRFHTLSNVDNVPGKIPLIHNWPGWWSKIEIFRPDLPFTGKVLYLDLDTILVRDLYAFAHFNSKLAFCPPSYTFTGGSPRGRAKDGKFICDEYNSSVIVFNPGEGQRIYEKFGPHVIEMWRGDQDWMGTILPKQDTFPPEWFMKLKQCENVKPEPPVKIVFSMPWKNNVAIQKFPWVREIWKVDQ